MIPIRVDNLDGTLVCEKNDYQTVLTYFKEYRKVPEYIEMSILKIVLEQLTETNSDYNSVKEYFNVIPEEFMRDTINDINTMFSPYKKAQYKKRYLAYLLYYLPANIYKIWKPLLDLHLRNLLQPNLRIMDIGTGPGSVAVGMVEYYRALAESFPEILFSLHFCLIDSKQEFLDIADRMFFLNQDKMPANLKVNLEHAICRDIQSNSNNDYLGKFDLITMSNFLHISEGDNYNNAKTLLTTFKDNLKPKGALIVIEPGDQISCKSLKKVRNDIVNSSILNVFSPCIGVWEEKTHYNCICFNMVRYFWETPIIYNYLVLNGLNKAKRIDVPFNYVVLRKDSLKKYPCIKNQQYYVKLRDLKLYARQEVNIIALIRTVIDRASTLQIALCDGSCSFEDDDQSVWIVISKAELEKQGIIYPLIAAERIKLKKVLVEITTRKINLVITKATQITIDY